MDGSEPTLAGSGGVGGVMSDPWDQFTSAKRGWNAAQFSGHLQGASGARSRSHFRTDSPVGYVRLSKNLHPSRIGMPAIVPIGDLDLPPVPADLLSMRLSRTDRAPSGPNSDHSPESEHPATPGTPVTPGATTSPDDGLWSTLTVAGVAAAILGPDGAIEWCNPAFADIASRTPDEVVAIPILTALGVNHPDRLRPGLVAAARGETPLRRFEVETVDWAGKRRTVAVSASLTDLWIEPHRVVVIAEDLTAERRGKNHRLRSAIDVDRRATEDALTGLPNRATFEALLESSLRRSRRNLTTLAVLSIDLDGFRVVNERLGTSAGDELLRAVAHRLTDTLRHDDFVTRSGGDQFIVVAEQVDTESLGHQLARRLASHVADPLVVDGVDVRIGCSIGFTLASGHERAAELIAEAEQAMAGAKRAGKGRSMSVSQLRAGPGSAAQSSRIDWNELAVERPDPEPEGDPIPGLPAPTEGLAEELLPNLDLDHNRHDKARFDTEDSANR